MKNFNFVRNLFDLSTGFKNLKGKSVHFDGLFKGKPKNFGEAIAKIKQKFNVVSENLTKIPGQRFYSCADGSQLQIYSTGKTLGICKHITPITEMQYNSTYPGKLARIKKSYHNFKLGDNVILDRSIDIEKFKPAKIDKADCGLLSFDDLGRQGVQDVMNKATNRKHYHNVREIPYTQAMSIGLKI